MTQAPTPEPLRRRLVLLAALLVTAVGGLWWASGLDAAGIFDAHAWARQTDRLLAWQQQSPVLFMAGFMFLFVLLSVLALPGCWALSLLAGSAFGTFAGTPRFRKLSVASSTSAWPMLTVSTTSSGRATLGSR